MTGSSSQWLEQGRSSYSAGQFSDAAATWQKAAEAYEREGDRANQALSLSYLSLANQELNQWDQAQRAIDQSLSLLQSSATDAILMAQVLNTQASLLLHTGQSNAALETWQQAQTYYHEAGDQWGELGSQINQAQAWRSLGFYRRSKQILEEVNLSLTALPDSELKVAGLRELGVALQVVGDVVGSREVLLTSMAIADRMGTTTEKTATLLSLGQTASDWGDAQAALTLFEQAEQAAMNPAEQVQARLGLLRLYLNDTEENHDRMEAIAPKIYQQLTELPASRTSIYASVNLVANLLKAAPNLLPTQQLAELLANATASAKNLRDPQAEAYALNQWGQLYIQKQQWPDAYQVTQKSLAIARTLQADDIASQSAWQLGKILKQQGKQTDAIAAYTEAYHSLQSLRRDLAAINPDIQFSFRQSVEPVYRELVALLLNHDHPSQTELIQARAVIEALQLAELDNFFREACLDTQAEQIDQVDPHAAVIYPIILPDRLAVIVSVVGQPLRYYNTAISTADVNGNLREFLTSLHPASDRAEQLRISQQIYDWLIRPAETEQALAQTQTLVFVLDGLLRNVPMAALYDGNQFLIEKYSVTLSPGLQLMATQLHPQEETAIIAGISESRHGFSALPAVDAEVKDISQLLPSSTLLNQEFTSEALEQQIQNSKADIIHLATHGQFSSRLEDTFLLTWEDRLDIQELSSLLQNRANNRAIDLLVLSACDTASGDDRAVLGLAGLAVKSGARSTLATLWPVKDTAAATLMNQFYQFLKEPGMSKAAALRKAQLTLIADENYADPFFWSTFVLVGNWL